MDDNNSWLRWHRSAQTVSYEAKLLAHFDRIDIRSGLARQEDAGAYNTKYCENETIAPVYHHILARWFVEAEPLDEIHAMVDATLCLSDRLAMLFIQRANVAVKREPYMAEHDMRVTSLLKELIRVPMHLPQPIERRTSWTSYTMYSEGIEFGLHLT